MKTMKWLLRREFWENQGSIFWTPIVVGGLFIVLLTLPLVYGLVTGAFANMQVSVNGQSTGLPAMVAAFASANQIAVAHFTVAVSIPLFVIQAVIVFFYLLDALYDERRDRSILFWKSLPLSDTSTVLSKVLMAVVVAPLIALAASTAAALVMLVIICLALTTQGVNLFGAVFLHPELYLRPVQVLGVLPIYIMWALPTVGWLLLVSAWARSKPFLWAVGTPLAILLMRSSLASALVSFEGVSRNPGNDPLEPLVGQNAKPSVIPSAFPIITRMGSTIALAS